MLMASSFSYRISAGTLRAIMLQKTQLVIVWKVRSKNVCEHIKKTVESQRKPSGSRCPHGIGLDFAIRFQIWQRPGFLPGGSLYLKTCFGIFVHLFWKQFFPPLFFEGKAMKQYYFKGVFALILASFVLQGYQCGSPEFTGAKVHMQQKNFTEAIRLLEIEVQKN